MGACGADRCGLGLWSGGARRWGGLALAALLLAGCAARPEPSLTERAGAEVRAATSFVNALPAYQSLTLTAHVAGALASVTDAAIDADAWEGPPPPVRLLDSSTIGSYATSDGEILMTRGMLALLSDEAELAWVLGHELAHHALGHVSAPPQPDLRGVRRPAEALARLSAALQARELEADAAAVLWLIGAGYDPAAPARVLGKLSGREAGGAAPRRYFETHPGDGARLAALAEMAPPAAAEAGASREGVRRAEAHRAATEGLPFAPTQPMIQRRGDQLIAPYLRIAAPMPAEFEVLDAQGPFMLLEHVDGRRYLFLSAVEALSEDPEIFLRDEVYPSLRKAFSLGPLREIEARRALSAPAITGLASLRPRPGGRVDGRGALARITALRLRGASWLLLVSIAPRADWPRMEAVVATLEAGATPLTAASLPRLSHRRAPAGLDAVSAGFGEGEAAARAFRALNGLGPAASPRPGAWVKTLVSATVGPD